MITDELLLASWKSSDQLLHILYNQKPVFDIKISSGWLSNFLLSRFYSKEFVHFRA